MQVCTNITLYFTAYLFCLELIFTSCSFLLQFCVLCTDKITKVISRYFRKTIHIFLNIDSTNTRYVYASKLQKNVLQIFFTTHRSCDALKKIYQRVSWAHSTVLSFHYWWFLILLSIHFVFFLIPAFQIAWFARGDSSFPFRRLLGGLRVIFH